MDLSILIYVLVGFVAQIIDGALGMAYGVSSNSFLMSVGIPPKFASASVHVAEVFTTGVSGISHWRLGNIDKDLIKRLLIPGVLGGIVGAYLLTSLDGNKIKPFVAVYLLVMGLVILIKAVRQEQADQEVKTNIIPLGLVGGFFDAIGGGGWGPIVTTTLVARGKNPRYSIGSVNFSEFFLTFAISVTFLLTINLTEYWKIILGLLVGGVMAAPLAAIITRRMPARLLMGLVGALIVGLQVRQLILSYPTVKEMLATLAIF